MELPAVIPVGVERLPRSAARLTGLRSSPTQALEIVDHPLGARRPQLRLVVGGGHADGPHAGRAGGVDPYHRILEDHTAGGIGVEAAGGEEIDLRIGLAEADVVGRHHHREMPAEAQPGQDIVHIPARGRGADGARDAATRELGHEGGRAGTARKPRREKPA